MGRQIYEIIIIVIVTLQLLPTPGDVGDIEYDEKTNTSSVDTMDVRPKDE